MTGLDPAALAVRFGRALEQAGVPYAIGGAIAHGFWGVPRGTRDLDVSRAGARQTPQGTRPARVAVALVRVAVLALPIENYWTASTHFADANGAIQVNLGTGGATALDKAQQRRRWCVRGGAGHDGGH